MKNGIARGISAIGRIAALTLALLAMASPAAAQAPAAPLVFAGSGSNLPIIRVLVQAFQKSHPGVTIEVPPSIGSSSAVRAAADGAIAMGLISRPLKEKEKGLGLVVEPFARTPMIIGAHAAVSDDSITPAELVDIYKGKKMSWRDGREIVVLTREPGDSSIEVLEKGVPGFREAYAESQQAKRWTTLLKDLEMNQALARTPAAIGFSDLGSLTIERHAIKALKVNGVAPTVKNLESGKYQLSKTLTFVYHKERVPPQAKQFQEFVHSKAGKKIMRDNGYLPEK